MIIQSKYDKYLGDYFDINRLISLTCKTYDSSKYSKRINKYLELF